MKNMVRHSEENPDSVKTENIKTAIMQGHLEKIPNAYKKPTEEKGRLVPLRYQTWESFSYNQHKQRLVKTAWIYLPYGYSDQKKYNIFYISHGGWSDETTVMGTDQDPSPFKNVMDHAIQDGKIRPLILVMLTYNNTSGSDSSDYSLALDLTNQYHHELVNDLIPAVEKKYSTYAGGNVTPAGIQGSRNHRGFGGFSMGAVNTWRTFQYCLRNFRYFMPMSGSVGFSGARMQQIVKKQGYGENDFFIFAASGTEDFAEEGIRSQIQSMVRSRPSFFRYGKCDGNGNISYMEQKGFSHGEEAAEEYTYNGLRFFWNTGNHSY